MKPYETKCSECQGKIVASFKPEKATKIKCPHCNKIITLGGKTPKIREEGER